jgi:hypothetical protein
MKGSTNLDRSKVALGVRLVWSLLKVVWSMYKKINSDKSKRVEFY